MKEKILNEKTKLAKNFYNKWYVPVEFWNRRVEKGKNELKNKFLKGLYLIE